MADQKKKLLFIVTYISRDWEGISLVAWYLKRYGFELVYTNGYDIKAKVLKHKPDGVVWDHLTWDFKVEELKFVKQLGCMTFCLPTEGLFYDEHGAVKATGEFHGSQPFLDLYFVWGEYVKNAILKENILPAEKVPVVGSPRFDFYNLEKFSKYYTPREEFCKNIGIKNADNPIVLWAPTSVFIGRDKEERLKMYTERGENSIERLQHLFEDGDLEFEKHGNLICQMAEQHPEWNFIIKIHPAAWVEPYVPFTEKYPNIFLGYNAHIRNFLYHSAILIQRNCTTATEAWIMNKPVIQLEAANYHFQAPDNYKKASTVVTSFDQVEPLVKDYIAGKPIPESELEYREKFIESFYYKIDGLSAKRTADILNEYMSEPYYTSDQQAKTRNNLITQAKAWDKEQSSRLSNRVKDVLGLDRNQSLRFWDKSKKKKMDSLTQGEAEPTQEMEAHQMKKIDQLHLS